MAWRIVSSFFPHFSFFFAFFFLFFSKKRAPPLPDFMYDGGKQASIKANGMSNLAMIDAAKRAGVPKVVVVGASMPAWVATGYETGECVRCVCARWEGTCACVCVRECTCACRYTMPIWAGQHLRCVHTHMHTRTATYFYCCLLFCLLPFHSSNVFHLHCICAHR